MLNCFCDMITFFSIQDIAGRTRGLPHLVGTSPPELPSIADPGSSAAASVPEADSQVGNIPSSLPILCSSNLGSFSHEQGCNWVAPKEICLEVFPLGYSAKRIRMRGSVGSMQ